MAGRRWAEGGKRDGGDGRQHLRPSERGQGQTPPPPKVSRRERERAARAAAAANRPAPSPEAIARAKERLAPPKAPWHPLPLAELGIVFGLVAMAVGFVLGNVAGAAAGFGLMLLSTLEFTWREHRHGYRSHGAVLGGVLGLVVATVCWRYVGLSRYGSGGAGFVAFLAIWGLLTKTYVPREDREAAASSPDPS